MTPRGLGPGRGWVAVDLDGTLAAYDGWHAPDHIGAPVPEMVAVVRALLAAGWDVRIFTARVDGGQVASALGDDGGEAFRDVDRVRAAIETWCEAHVGRRLPVTNVKDYGMVALIDDRAFGVVPNTGRFHGRHPLEELL